MSNEAVKPKSDLPVRFVSAVVMLAIVAGAMWAGGAVFRIFVAAIGLGLLWEYWNLVQKFATGVAPRLLWMAFGIAYIGIAILSLLGLEHQRGLLSVAMVIGAVIATDVGAYFSGRTIGGPKIAPKISPSKTWAGLIGGMILACVFMYIFARYFALMDMKGHGWIFTIFGAAIAIVAQAGDFFESWMKRSAGVKDSGALIPGHGGLFDRMDGLLPALIITYAAIGQGFSFALEGLFA